MNGGDEVAEKLSALPSADAAVRCQTLLEVAGHPAPLPQLWPFLDDTDAAVRVAAVHALWQTGTGQDALDRLVEVLSAVLALPEGSSPTDDAILMAGSVLQAMGQAAVRPLIRGFRADAPWAHRIVFALADIGTDDAVVFLRQVAAGPPSKGAHEATRALLDLESEHRSSESTQGSRSSG